MPVDLPIHDLEPSLVSSLREQPRAIISAPTGSGKSTQIPQMLLRNGFLDRGTVIVLQPRRLAARLLAARVAEERGVPLGGEVGYQVRFENVAGPETRILFVTEGILLRRMIDDPSLRGVAALVFDEFHERHLHGDVSLARALDLQVRARPDLKILVMSATLDGERLEEYLRPCATLSSQGRMFPVKVEYTPPPSRGEPPVWELAADAFARHAGDGDALVFMPGAYEIARTIDAVRARPEASGRLLLPLHGELPPRDQDAAVARHGRLKIVVATNVAETSITIDGVRLVIDSGLARMARHDPYRGINTLFVEKISRASADQRAGRAGRTAPGVCVRLWDEREHARRPAREVPEIRRLDLSEIVLTLKSAGVEDLKTFRWIDPPDEKSLAHAEELLTDLGALRGGAVTELGRRMLAFPLHPRWSRMLLAARDLGCVREAALAAALAQGRDLLLRNVDRETEGFREERFGGRVDSDFALLMKAWSWAAEKDFRPDACRRAGLNAAAAKQVGPLVEQFVRLAGAKSSKFHVPGSKLRTAGDDASDLELGTWNLELSDEPLRKCILMGFSDRVAKRLDGGSLRCDLVHGRRGDLARESAVRHSPLLVAAEVREVEGREIKTLLSLATAVEPGWLAELFPDDMNRRVRVAYDAGAKRVTAEEQVCFRDLAIESRRIEPPPAEEAARLLAAEVVSGRLALKEWNDGVEQWIRRVNFLARTCPDLEIPPIGDPERRTLLEQICHGAWNWKDLKDRPVLPAVKGWLDAARQALVEKHAPERLELSNGKKPKVTYEPEGPPFIALRIQDLYDVTQLPKLALGRATPLLHILAPSQRPVQITQDLPGFWRDHYPRIKKELQRKYPKHEWR